MEDYRVGYLRLSGNCRSVNFLEMRQLRRSETVRTIGPD